MAVARSRRRGQALVEFGIISLLFTLLVFAVVDLGLLLNTWLSVSAASRDLARSASVGKKEVFLEDQAKKMIIPAVSSAGFANACCAVGDAVVITVTYYDCGPPGPCAMTELAAHEIHQDFWGGTKNCTLGDPGCPPLPDNRVKVTVQARGAQVITPLVRPFFGCLDGSVPICNVTLTSSTTTRYEGQEF